MMVSIDLNCDMGESFGNWSLGNDAELMDFVTSINIACGFHAGDATVIRQTVETALQKGVSIGAHPSFPDLQGFGRRQMRLSETEVFDIVLYQVSAVKGICKVLGGNINHVKPHGALYNQGAAESPIAAAIVRAVKAIDKNLIFYGLSGSHLIHEAKKNGLRTASEVFADRSYQPDGSLTPRIHPEALVTQPEKAAKQILEMVETGQVTSISGEKIPIVAETVCIHGDGARALDVARTVREKLIERGIEVCPR